MLKYYKRQSLLLLLQTMMMMLTVSLYHRLHSEIMHKFQVIGV